MENLIHYVTFVVPLITVIAAVLVFLLGMNWLLLARHPEFGNERKLPRQLVMLGLTIVGVVIIAIALPVSDLLRKQIVALIGVLISGAVAFSSATIIANFIAGLMLRMNKPFKTGDFIRVDEYFGRVSERGLLDTEIQSEHRELIALPNIYLINNPVTVVSASGAIVSADISLGYDIHHSHIHDLLIAAAKNSGLEEPFVQIMVLGNFSVSYRVSGLLEDVKGMISACSALHRAILDTLHNDGIEIVSPTFMNQRPQDARVRIIPRTNIRSQPDESLSKPEEIVFEKAEKAEQQEAAINSLREEIESLEEQSKNTEGDKSQSIAELVEQKREELMALESVGEDTAVDPSRPSMKDDAGNRSDA